MSGNKRRKISKADVVNLLWQLKKSLQEHEGIFVNLKMLTSDESYRVGILSKSLRSSHPTVRSCGHKVKQLHDKGLFDTKAGSLNASPSIADGVNNSEESQSQPNNRKWGFFVAALLALFVGAGFYFNGGQQVVPEAVAGTAEQELIQTAPEVTPVIEPKPLLPVTNPEVVLRIHGSNTVGSQLSPALVEAYLKEVKGAELVVQNIPNPDQPLEKQIQAILPGKKNPIAVEIFAHGSSTGFKDLSIALTDMGQSSRRAKISEVEKLKPSHGDLYSSSAEHIIALDGLAVIVHKTNEITTLTSEQIAGLFSGEITDWQQVGGKPGPVTVYARDKNSGTFDTFKGLVLKKFDKKLIDTAKRYESNAELSDDVAQDPNAIGFTGLPYVRRSKLLAVADEQGALPIIPTKFTVGTEDYPLARRLYFYTSEIAENPLVDELVEFSLSQRGQQIVEQIGFVSQNIYTVRQPFDPSLPQEYTAMTAESERLSLNFRFRSGSYQLDNKSQRDLARLVTFLEDNPEAGSSLMLLGFTDNVGEPEINAGLSQQRAEAVEKMLATYGVYPFAVKGFGEAAPIASNKTNYGRNKNRRVEVWIKPSRVAALTANSFNKFSSVH